MDTIYSLYFQYEGAIDFIFFLAATFIVAHLVTFIFTKILFRLAAKTKNELDDSLVETAQKPVYWGVVLGGFYLALTSLKILADYHAIVKIVTQIGFILILIIVTIKFSTILFEFTTKSKKITYVLNY